MPDERRLVRRIQQGERRAFEEFVDSYGPRIHRLVRRYVDNPTDAEDVTQEVFCDLYRSISKFRGESALNTWVYRVVVNHCLKHCQRVRPESLPYEEQVLPDDEWQADPVRSAVQQELSEKVQAALARLSPLHYDVVVLCELHGLTYQECAHVLDVPVGTVKSRLYHGIRRLRDSLGGYVLGDWGALPAGALGETAR